MEPNVKNMLNIGTGTMVRAVLVLIFFYSLYLLHELVLVVLTSIVVASAIEPAAQWFAARRVPRILAVLLVYAFMLVSFASVFYFFFPPIFKDLAQLVSALPSYLDFLDEWNPWSEFFNYKALLVDFSKQFTPSSFIYGKGEGVGSLASTVGGVFGGLVNFVLVLVISFYLAVQERGIENFLRIIVPVQKEEYVISLWRRSQKKIGLWMQGQLLLAVIVGALVYLGLSIVGVPHAFLLAVIAAIFELIPVFGATLAAIPAVIIAFGESVFMGGFTVIWYFFIQQFENHLLYPVVVRKVVGVPPILVIISLLVGLKLGGFMGIILSVPLAAALVEFINDFEKSKGSEQRVPGQV